jgi:hypothetical protein
MMAGAYALRDGLSLAQHLGCQNFIFQSNNMQVIKTMLLGGVSSRSSVAIYDDCQILSLVSRNITFQHSQKRS